MFSSVAESTEVTVIVGDDVAGETTSMLNISGLTAALVDIVRDLVEDDDGDEKDVGPADDPDYVGRHREGNTAQHAGSEGCS